MARNAVIVPRKKRLLDVFPHPKRDASLLSAHQKALQHEVVVLEAVLHEIFELLVLRVVGGLCDPHDQPSYDGHVYSGVFLSRCLEVLPHDDVQLPVRCLDAPVVDLAFEKRQRIAVRQVSYVVHRLPACLFPFSAGLRGGCLVDDGDASYGVEAAALRKAFEQEGSVDQGMAFVGLYPSVPFLDKGTVRKAAEGAVRPLSLRFRPDRLQQCFLVRLHGQKVMCLLLQYHIDDGLLGSDGVDGDDVALYAKRRDESRKLRKLVLLFADLPASDGYRPAGFLCVHVIARLSSVGPVGHPAYCLPVNRSHFHSVILFVKLPEVVIEPFSQLFRKNAPVCLSQAEGNGVVRRNGFQAEQPAEEVEVELDVVGNVDCGVVSAHETAHDAETYRFYRVYPSLCVPVVGYCLDDVKKRFCF